MIRFVERHLAGRLPFGDTSPEGSVQTLLGGLQRQFKLER